MVAGREALSQSLPAANALCLSSGSMVPILIGLGPLFVQVARPVFLTTTVTYAFCPIRNPSRLLGAVFVSSVYPFVETKDHE